MGRPRSRRASHAFILLALSACNDLDDVQVPLIPSRRTPEELPVFERRDRPQAVTSITIGEPHAASCPIAHSSLLPPSADPGDLQTGTGDRLINDTTTRVECYVEALAEPNTYLGPTAFEDIVFDIALFVVHPSLPHLAVSGPLRKDPDDSAPLTLEVDTSEGHKVDAECRGEVRSLFPGAAWFELAGCTPKQPELLGCNIAGAFIIENCIR
jgi:hypothetical protein